MYVCILLQTELCVFEVRAIANVGTQCAVHSVEYDGSSTVVAVLICRGGQRALCAMCNCWC